MRVAALYVYPVKACGALAPQRVALDARGAEGDRGYAFVGPDGRPLTQREAPRLATIRPRRDGAALLLDFAGHEALELAPANLGRLGAVASRFLGREVRLVAAAPRAPASFADAAPLLAVSLATLALLNARLAEPLGVERFRANIVLEGAPALAEAGWRALRGRSSVLECAGPCERCEVVTIDQTSGEARGAEPLAELAARLGNRFGVYCRVAVPGVLERGETLSDQW